MNICINDSTTLFDLFGTPRPQTAISRSAASHLLAVVRDGAARAWADFPSASCRVCSGWCVSLDQLDKSRRESLPIQSPNRS